METSEEVEVLATKVRIYKDRMMWLLNNHPDIYEQMLEGAVSEY